MNPGFFIFSNYDTNKILVTPVLVVNRYEFYIFLVIFLIIVVGPYPLKKHQMVTKFPKIARKLNDNGHFNLITGSHLTIRTDK